MPNITLYVSFKDQITWTDAKTLAAYFGDESLSSIVATLLRNYTKSTLAGLPKTQRDHIIKEIIIARRVAGLPKRKTKAKKAVTIYRYETHTPRSMRHAHGK